MSKEQTPIDILRDNLGKNIPNFIEEKAVKAMEQYAQAKVLEALEREFSVIYVSAFDIQEINGKHYYETEVKPKYKQINK